IVGAVKNGGRNNGICFEADIGEKRSRQQGLHVHEEHTRPRMFGVVKPLNDERRVPESPDQANNCGSFPETQGTEFPLKETSPAQLLTETGEGVDRYSCDKALEQDQENRPGKSVCRNLDSELLGFQQQVPEVVLLVRGESHSGDEQRYSES